MKIDDLGVCVSENSQLNPGAAVCGAHPPMTCGWPCSYTIMADRFHEFICVRTLRITAFHITLPPAVGDGINWPGSTMSSRVCTCVFVHMCVLANFLYLQRSQMPLLVSRPEHGLIILYQCVCVCWDRRPYEEVQSSSTTIQTLWKKTKQSSRRRAKQRTCLVK